MNQHIVEMSGFWQSLTHISTTDDYKQWISEIYSMARQGDQGLLARLHKIKENAYSIQKMRIQL